MSQDARAGHHADFVWLHEDGADGFRGSPSDSTQKIFGGDQRLETFEGSHQAVRVWNSDRTAEEIIKQLFDGAWSVTGTLGAVEPWWLSAVFGSPSTSGSAAPYTHEYSLDVGGDPESIRILQETEGTGSLSGLLGCVPQTLSVNQAVPGNPQFTLTGVYAEPSTMASTISPPSFDDSTFKWSDATLDVGGSTIARIQNAGVTMALNTDLIPELGAEYAVDYSPKVFAPQVEYDKIVQKSPSVDLEDRFLNGSTASAVLEYDNGGTGSEKNYIKATVGGGLPNDWSRAGVNDPEADLVDSLTEMSLDASIELQNDTDTPQ